MKCEYIGKSEDHNYREVYITYGTNEQRDFNKLYDILLEKGWKLECEEECACLIVYDKSEYDEFYKYYKEAKWEVKNGKDES